MDEELAFPGTDDGRTVAEVDAYIKAENAAWPAQSGRVLTLADSVADLEGEARPLTDDELADCGLLSELTTDEEPTAPAPVAQPEHGGDIRKCRDCADFGPTCPWDGKACASSAAPAPVAPILTDAQIEQMWSNAFNDTSGVKMSQVLARAIERACAEAWGVKLVEATGQEGGAA